MARFTDCKGRDWELRLTLGLVKPLREAGFNVADAASFARLDDPDLIGRVLWILCEDRATDRGLSPEEFVKGFDGPAIFGAIDALQDAYCDFFHRPEIAPVMKERFRGAIQRMTEASIRSITSEPSGNSAASPESPAAT